MEKKIAKLLARLTALKDNIPESSDTPQKYVNEFHSILTSIEEASEEILGEFVIPDEEIKPIPTSYSPSTGRTYSSERYCDKEFILMKIDGVLGYFTLILQPEETKEKLGFRIEEQ